MVLWRISINEFRSRPLRTMLTLASIVIGVGAVVSVALAIDNARDAQRSMLQAVAGNASFEITAEGGTPFDQEILSSVRTTPNVRAASPMLRRYSVMFMEEDRKVRVQLLGVDANMDSEVRDYRVKSGNNLNDPSQAASSQPGILVDAAFAKSLSLTIGSKVKFVTRSGLREASVVGLIEPRSGSAILQGGIVLISIEDAQSWFRAGQRIDAIQVVATDDSKLDSLEKSLRTLLPSELALKTPSLRSDLGQESTLATEQGLRLASAFSLMIAIFIIYNTFQMNVGERRRQLGTLRALGTTRKQVVQMIVREGLILGILGTVIGLGVGWYAAKYLTGASSQLLDMEIVQQKITWYPFALAAVSGIGVALAGAYFPAKRASRLAPSEAMRVVSAGELEPSNTALAYLGSALSTIGFIVLLLCVNGIIHIDHAIMGTILFLLGGIVILPTVLHTLSDWVLAMFGGKLGIEGRLAQRQLLRHRGRSSLTIGILFIALSTGLGMSCTILDNIRNVNEWTQRALLGDYFVRATMPNMATGQSADMPLGLLEEIKTIPGITNTETIRFANARAGDITAVVVAREYPSADQQFFDLVHGTKNQVFQDVIAGDVVIGSVLGERAKLGFGDQIEIETPNGPQKLRIAGVANDYNAAGLTIHMTRKRAEELLNLEGIDAIIISADESQKEEVEAALATICNREGLLLQSYAELVSVVREKVDSVVSGLWAVLALGSVVAAFGLVNTLSMNVLEQTSEIGMLRVVAMTRNQVRRMILSQAFLMGFIGLIPAVLAGTMIAYLLSLSVLPTTGYSVQFYFRPGLTVAAFAGELLIVVVASLIPAERATRIRVAEAMQYQ